VLAAVAASSASAKLPEWGQCRETASGSDGKYGNANCTQQVKKVYGSYPGAYEWYPLERQPGEIESGQQTKLHSSYDEEGTTTFRFASGRELRCTSGYEESRLPLDGANVVTDAIETEWNGCEEPVLELENHGEPGLGENYPGTCFTPTGGYGISTEDEYRNGESTPPEGATWNGKTEFLGAKTASTPSVGIAYKTNPGKERFFPQIDCEGGENSRSLSIQIGGHKRSEELVAEITPVNTMLQHGFTATLRPQAKGTMEALVNTGEYEPVTIESSIYFGGAVYIGPEQRLAWEEQYGGPNYRYNEELELKASP